MADLGPPGHHKPERVTARAVAPARAARVGGCRGADRPAYRMAAAAVMGRTSGTLPVEPLKMASPKENTPPSEAMSQYPPPPAVLAMPTMGLFGLMPSDRREP